MWSTTVLTHALTSVQRYKSVDTLLLHPIPSIIKFDKDYTFHTITLFCLKKSQYLQLQELLNHTRLSSYYVIRQNSVRRKTSAQSPDRNQTDQCSIQTKVPSHFPALRHKSPLRPTALHKHTDVSPNCVRDKRYSTWMIDYSSARSAPLSPTPSPLFRSIISE